MDTPWFLTNLIWLCLGEIQVIVPKTMFGCLTSTKALSNGKSMNFKTRSVLHLEYITVLQFVNKAQLKA